MKQSRKSFRLGRFALLGAVSAVLLGGFYFAPASLVSFVPGFGAEATAALAADQGPDTFDQNRARLLSYVLRRQVGNHYSGKTVDDELSRAAFHLYMKQLDSQKRFLLKAEADQLRTYETRIDDELSSGQISLAPLGASLLQQAVLRAETIVREILAKPFDLRLDDSYETDPEKLEFCSTKAELVERWRLELKYRTVSRYLNLMEDAGFHDPAKVPQAKAAELEQDARAKVLKSHEDYFSRLLKETTQDHYDRYLNAFVRAFDPHSSYMAPQTKEDFDIGMRGSLEGIGATLREEDGYIKVVKIFPGSAADRQGELHADDIILAVAQGTAEPVEVTDMRLRDAVSLIRGPKGTEVRLTIRRAGHKPFGVAIIRDIVVIEESFVKSVVVVDPVNHQRYGYIRIPSFYRDFEETRNGGGGRNSTDDVRAALEDLQKQQIQGLILDLRNNGGGALTDAVGVTGLFIESGPVVQVRTSGGYTKVLKDDDASIAYRGPMIVMVNQFSASASEIVAGALQDYRRAIIVGSEHTHGKGTVQVIADLDQSMTLKNMQHYLPLGALKLTTQKFYRITGESTQYRGVVPDIVLPDRRQYNKFGERYLDYSLPWDSIDAVDYRVWTSEPLDYAQISQLSRARIATDKEFAEIRHTAEILRERLENTRQPLNLDKVYQEWQDVQGDEAPHGAMADAADEAEDGKDAEGETLTSQQRLLKSLERDPYAQEVMAVLRDVEQERASLARSNRILHAN